MPLPISPAPAIYIKDVAIRIHKNYNFRNTPRSLQDPEDGHERNKEVDRSGFIGRRKLMDILEAFLRKGEKGVYLVTGYRGMGKTSFVHQVLNELKENKHQNGANAQGNFNPNKLQAIGITVTQANLSEETILRDIVGRLYELEGKQTDRKEHIFSWLKRALQGAILVLGLLLIPVVLYLIAMLNYPTVVPKNFFPAWLTTYNAERVMIYLITAIVLLMLSLVIVIKTKSPHGDAYRLIDSLFRRGYGSYTAESQDQSEFTVNALYAKVASKPSAKQTYTYPIASVKELEYGLERYLKLKRKDCRYVFVFDELDKIELPAVTTSYYEDLASFETNKTDTNYLQQMRRRKQTIINTIAGLKSFLTRADATFIFIAGREMFDASLADISDRDASISSIFSYVFYVDSFLKESVNQKDNTSLSLVIESYLAGVLFDVWEDPQKQRLYVLFRENFIKERRGGSDYKVNDETTWEEGDRMDLNKMIVMLQNLVIYLTYRSNGSPKKLIRAVQEFIRIYNDEDFDKKELGDRVVVATLDNQGGKKIPYLYFNFNDQYRIGFINYLYRPFLIKYGKSFKNYSDSIVASTPYLFDHLLKFHPFAFSLKDLEMLPEVLSTSKTQSLREHIVKIVEYLYNSHIREAEIALFDYKFYSRILNEITFVSKIFEAESAAFNFTLDESYLVKLHVRSKIKELRSIYSRFKGDERLKKQIFSIFHLNTVLGDLHFFDQEYDDAITSYSDAIGPLGNISESDFSYVDFASLISCKLKLGLCFEKMGSMQVAHAYYTDASDDSKRFVFARLHRMRIAYQQEIGAKGTPPPWRKDKGISPDYTGLSEIQLTISQTFLAKLVAEEKKDNQLSVDSIFTAFDDFLLLSRDMEVHGRGRRNTLVHANFYLVMGNLLYFKNTCEGLETGTAGISAEQGKRVRRRSDKLDQFLGYVRDFNSGRGGGRYRPTGALAFYLLGLEEVLAWELENSPKVHEGNAFKGLWRVMAVLDNERLLVNPHFSKNHFRYIGILLSNIGNCMFSMAPVASRTNKRTAKIRYRELWNPKSGFVPDRGNIVDTDNFYELPLHGSFLRGIRAGFCKDGHPDFSVGDVLRAYYLSAVYFAKSGRSTTSSYQLKKILYVIRMVLADEPEENYDKQEVEVFIAFLWETVMEPMMMINSRIVEFSDRHMIAKYDQILNPCGSRHGGSMEKDPEIVNGLYKDANSRASTVRQKNLAYIRDNISNHPETREASALYYYICLKLILDPLRIPPVISNHHSIASQFTRLLEIDLFQKLNARKLWLGQREPDEDRNKLEADYLFSLVSVVNVLTVYGVSYTISYNYLGYTHLQIGKWLRENEGNAELEDILARVKKYGSDSNSAVLHDAHLHFSKAKECYEKAIQLHTGGNQFKRNMEQMVYLEDDINDNAFNFGAAMERYLYYNGVLDKCIAKCNKELGYHNGDVAW